MIRVSLLVYCVLFSCFVFAQNAAPTKIVYYDRYGIVCSRDSAMHYVNAIKKDSLWFVRGYYMNDVLEMVGAYSDDSFLVEEGVFTYYDEQGLKEEECEYKKGKQIQCKYWEGTGERTEIITFKETMPEFPGGQDSLKAFLKNEIVYPRKALRRKISGRVVVQFIINEDGSVSDVTTFKAVEKSIDEEAIRVIRLMPKWKPGTQNDKPVKVKYTLPIMFGIN